MGREAISTWYFVLVVVRLNNRFLLVHERKHGQKWYLPAGRVEPGENFADAAYRETLEETGVPVILESILRVQHTPSADGSARVRVIFVARPKDDTPPKNIPDDESLGSAWMTLEEIRRQPLRGAEVLQIFEYVAGGAPVYPLELITNETIGFGNELLKTQMNPTISGSKIDHVYCTKCGTGQRIKEYFSSYADLPLCSNCNRDLIDVSGLLVQSGISGAVYVPCADCNYPTFSQTYCFRCGYYFN